MTPPSAFEARVRELERAHRAGPGGASSWLVGWLGGVLGRRAPSVAAPLPVPSRGECAITWLGHASVRLRWSDAQALVDPCFARWLWGIKRAREPALAPGALDGTDLVLITHAHADHLHLPSLARLPEEVRARATAVTPRGVGRTLARLFSHVVEVAPGDRVETPGGALAATAVWVQHGERAVGYVVDGDGPTAFVVGDSGYFDGFAAIGARHRPDVALLPISSYRPNALRATHLSPLDALYAFEDLGAALLVPIHHGSFRLGYEPLAEPAAWMASLVKQRRLDGKVALLEVGQSCVARRA